MLFSFFSEDYYFRQREIWQAADFTPSKIIDLNCISPEQHAAQAHPLFGVVPFPKPSSVPATSGLLLMIDATSTL